MLKHLIMRLHVEMPKLIVQDGKTKQRHMVFHFQTLYEGSTSFLLVNVHKLLTFRAKLALKKATILSRT